jgi:polar amino acid transport system substrate-binding protein
MSGLRISRRGVIAGLGGTVLLPHKPALAQGVTLDKIKKAGELRVGCEAAYVPFTYRDRSGSIVGFDVEIVAKYLEPIRACCHCCSASFSDCVR